MPRGIILILEIDDNTPPTLSPFTFEGSIWDLKEDWGIAGSKDYAFIEALSGYPKIKGNPPAIPLRGVPPSCANAVKELKSELVTSWLTLGEILYCLRSYGLSINDIHPSLKRVLDVMELMEKQLGANRVRLIFAVDL